MNHKPNRHIMLVAGEASGDLLGASLMRAIREAVKAAGDEVRFSGVGGDRMAGEGLQSLFPMAELSVMGLAEILPKARRLLRRISETANQARTDRPDVLVTIDSPGFSFRLAKKLRDRNFPLLHYVAPQAWAWRPGRAKHMAGLVDHLLALLPFEPDFFAGYGVDCSFVGHPVVERSASEMTHADPERLRRAAGFDENQTVLALLPGSRAGEVRRHLPVFLAAATRAGQNMERAGGLGIVVPTVPVVHDEVVRALQQWPGKHYVLENAEGRADAFALADAALAASGTVSLELALAGVPSVIGYRTNPLTAAIVRRLLLTAHIALPNLLLREPVMAEFVQEKCRPDLLSAALMPLLNDPTARAAALKAKSDLHKLLGGEASRSPSQRAADLVLSYLP